MEGEGVAEAALGAGWGALNQADDGGLHTCARRPTGLGAGVDVKGASRRNRTDAPWTSGPTSRLNGAAITKWGTGPRGAGFGGRPVELRISVWDKLGCQVRKNGVRAEEPGSVAMPRSGERESSQPRGREHILGKNPCPF